MRHYFFDLVMEDERVVDEDGIDYFDEGSALYYGQMVADRLARDDAATAIKVHVLTDSGALLAVLDARPSRPIQRKTVPARLY
ncbi:hypothetical protein [Rhizobium alvei]|uniref:Uncharacterized protein n=1 Tax=Rhizobium alvei TaxID=1132659 RepID=A0ABT8YNF9_9HYPH|nr:hypothetical protein [Rhizobium alvei]MDO6964807.1 hypothetical protein [Rhizobium alvei]